MHNHLIINIVVIKNDSSISTPCCVYHWTGNHSTVHLDVAIQLTYIKSIDMLNKNTPGLKKVRPSQKHQLALKQLKSLISGGGQGPSCLLAIM